AALVRSPAQNVQRGHGAMRSESREAGILADVPQRMRPLAAYAGAVTRITTAGQAKRPQRLRVEVVLDPGPDLFSQGPTSRVCSALVGLTAVFGMGTGVTPPLQGPRTQLYQARLLSAQPIAPPGLGQPRDGRGAERERGDQREGCRAHELLRAPGRAHR